MGCGGRGGTKGREGSRVWKERPRGRGLGETTLPRLSPVTQGQKDASTEARWDHWPADDTPFLFAGGWAVTQEGSQWERRRWLYQLMLQRPEALAGTVISSLRPSPPPAASSLTSSHLRLPCKVPRASGGTNSPSFVPSIRHIHPSWVMGKTQPVTDPAPPPPATTPWTLGYLL